MAKSSNRPEPPAPGEGKRGAEGHIAYLLRQAQAAVRHAIDADLAAVGLTSPQFLLLTLLKNYPGASGADLARLAGLTPQTINLVVRRLEDQGLVQRAQHAAHGRILTLELTATGREQLVRCRRIADRTEERILALLEKDSETIVRRWLADVAITLSQDR